MVVIPCAIERYVSSGAAAAVMARASPCRRLRPGRRSARSATQNGPAPGSGQQETATFGAYRTLTIIWPAKHETCRFFDSSGCDAVQGSGSHGHGCAKVLHSGAFSGENAPLRPFCGQRNVPAAECIVSATEGSCRRWKLSNPPDGRSPLFAELRQATGRALDQVERWGPPPASGSTARAGLVHHAAFPAASRTCHRS